MFPDTFGTLLNSHVPSLSSSSLEKQNFKQDLSVPDTPIRLPFNSCEKSIFIKSKTVK